ncbi:DNA repair protein RecO [Aliihoeflea aestuarii]|jgi:DNA repair protein RecO (recombination protein O)|uniref:DNA repair protein RecO n=1 Tax=Aliihoeflea aestuarii TaxID=453840 RepID=UPI00209355C9|nr:DNA repair protein RecO [Aliihoeflea aestuarii]MCO6389419.1 DNA repair protein RecO [Aliihoeflea aestuarii]
MEWRDDGIILGTRRHGETSVILEVMTPAHGRHLGLVRGGRSRRMQPVLQPGNKVELVWRARLDEHLGFFAVEPVDLKAARLMESAASVYGLQLMAAHLRLLPERDPHSGLYETLSIVLDNLEDPTSAAELIVRFELLILEELGFGLDLERCAATGAREDLAYVSPKSGRAVSRAAGDPWRDKMLALPEFLQRGSRLGCDETTIAEAFRLTGFFLTRHIYEPRGMEEPDSRIGFLGALRKSFSKSNNGENAA